MEQNGWLSEHKDTPKPTSDYLIQAKNVVVTREPYGVYLVAAISKNGGIMTGTFARADSALYAAESFCHSYEQESPSRPAEPDSPDINQSNNNKKLGIKQISVEGLVTGRFRIGMRCTFYQLPQPTNEFIARIWRDGSRYCIQTDKRIVGVPASAVTHIIYSDDSVFEKAA